MTEEELEIRAGKMADRLERLLKFFAANKSWFNGYDPTTIIGYESYDEAIDFKNMNDKEVEDYLVFITLSRY